jgi:predicted Rossmann fold nucleotide-binding protein DprA/Smf involved in DNA uptake
MITSHRDVLHNFRISVPDEENENQNAKNIEKLNLSPEEKLILEKLIENASKEKLMVATGLEFGEFLTALTMLEMKNLVKTDSGLIRKVF